MVKVRSNTRWQITADEMPIYANWNSFNTKYEAIRYFLTIIHKSSTIYGLLETKMQLWKLEK